MAELEELLGVRNLGEVTKEHLSQLVKERVPEEYFGIQDVGARRMFLSAHPELQEFFVKQRTKRYE